MANPHKSKNTRVSPKRSEGNSHQIATTEIASYIATGAGNDECSGSQFKRTAKSLNKVLANISSLAQMDCKISNAFYHLPVKALYSIPFYTIL
ncbi:hypothetical protein LPB03_03070 [Polaribacter vadi]|uniref:Uncharacterized protein n=1 Tax=Polaribacter vadi TaxID=1774273 RepID=A0A1B8TYM1_9FLAO|nr:hypothetical protein [Polaribacter vadi]AOW16509.1 hypothetical protein LPB03_03070 [Polaribacter vadi]OBY64585.1 hypothetical protein LPB3_09425 [Polaribacter vadi]